jgi:tRNA G37 N-methylase TrmD
MMMPREIERIFERIQEKETWILLIEEIPGGKMKRRTDQGKLQRAQQVIAVEGHYHGHREGEVGLEKRAQQVIAVEGRDHGQVMSVLITSGNVIIK